MITPPEGLEALTDVLAHLDGVLGETRLLLQRLVDLERRDVLAPERLLHATDGAIEGLHAWQQEIRRHLARQD